MLLLTYAFSLGLVELGSEDVELVQGLLLVLLHLLKKNLLVVDDLIRLLLVLLDDVRVVSLALHLKFVVFLLKVKRVLFVQLDLLVVAHLHSLEVLHDWLLRDVVAGRELVARVLSLVLNVEDGALNAKSKDQ